MSDEMPEDVMDIARNVASAIHLKLHRAFVPEEGEAIIARALLAEREAMRERCASVADGYTMEKDNRQDQFDAGFNAAAFRIAQAIRSSHD